MTALTNKLCLLAVLLCLSSRFECADVSRRPHSTHPKPAFEKDSSEWGLPDECLTYTERYASALKKDFSIRANSPQGHHSFAVISWGLWHGMKLLPDQLAAMQVLALEAHAAGWDCWFLYRVETGSDLTPAEYQALFPPELRELVVIWDPEEVFALYDAIPDLPYWRDSYHHEEDAHHSSNLGYIPTVWFMHRFGAYKFSFQLETDVRFVGDWGKFFNAALNIAIATETPDWSTIPPGAWGPSATAEQPASTDLPTDLTGLPDLLNFVPISQSDKWANTAINITEPKYESLFMIWGGSRNLFDKMHEWSRKGKAMYYEGFMPTVAGNENLKMLWFRHPVYLSDQHEGQMTFHCCTIGAKDVYDDWLKKNHCLHPGLMHPVKLDGPDWQPHHWESWLRQ